MLVFGGLGSGGQGKHRAAIFLVAIMMPSGPPSIPRKGCSSSLSFGVSVPIIIPPSRSTPPILPRHPSPFSFQVSLSQSNSRAPPHSIDPPTPVVIVIVVFSVADLVIGCVLRGPSCAEIGADIESPDILYTVVVHRICVWQRLALILMRRGLPRSAWGWASYSLQWWVLVGRGVVLKCSGASDCCVGCHVVLPCSRAYTGW